MKMGVNFRNWGPYATRANLIECAQIADESGIDSIWVNDHIGFPPENFENPYGVPVEMGDIIDPFAMMSALAAVTNRVMIGSGIVVAPYRPALLTAKWLQSIQHISAGRLLFGVAAGYVKEEFRALGVEISERGQITDDTLDFLHHAFSGQPVEVNDQALNLAPQPPRPPFLIGGAPHVAIPRAIARGDGWIPVGISPEQLAPHVQTLTEQGQSQGCGPLQVVVMKTLPLKDMTAAIDLARAYKAAGATHLVHTQGYDTSDEYRAFVEVVSQEIKPAVE